MRAASFLLVVWCCSCRGGGPQNEPNETISPQAQAVPAPLENAAALASTHPPIKSPEGGPPPESWRSDRWVPAEVATREKETVLSLEATLRAMDAPTIPRPPEANASGLDMAKKHTEPRWTMDLGLSRARFVMASHGFVWPEGTELRARADRYGHLLFFPGLTTYRTLAAGSMRAVLGERRFDVAPFSILETTSGEGNKRLGMRTRRVDMSTRSGKGHVELARIADSGEGGTLLCRLLLDLFAAAPSLPVCGLDEVPVHAEFRWTTSGGIVFDALTITKRTDAASTTLLVPPPGAVYVASPPSSPAGQALLAPNELLAMRSQPQDLPKGNDKNREGSGLLLQNTTDQLRFVWIDGVPVAWVAPGASMDLHGLHRGRYHVQWRTFLGDAVAPLHIVTAPGKSHIGAPDAGQGGGDVSL